MIDQIQHEIEALHNLAAQYPDDALAQASIAGQINALEWVKGLEPQDDTPEEIDYFGWYV